MQTGGHCAHSWSQLLVCVQESNTRINSLDFHLGQDLLVTAGDDDAIRVYNVSTGQIERTVYSRKYGAAHVNFTHHPSAVIYASNKVIPRTFPCISSALHTDTLTHFLPEPNAQLQHVLVLFV